MTEILVTAAAGVLGAAVGSFLNVVAYRVPRGMSVVSPGSRCPHCDAAIRTRDNVPVLGWLLLAGRCRDCDAPISVRYPLVEAATAVLFGLLTMRVGPQPELPAYLFFAAMGMALALIDHDGGRLPNTLVIPSYIISVLLLMPADAWRGDAFTSVRAVAGVLAFSSVYLALALAYPPGVRIDAVKLAALTGLFLGWMSWSALLIGSTASLLLLGVGSRRPGAARPDAVNATMLTTAGPCLMAAAVIALVASAPLGAWYGSLWGLPA